MGQSGGGGGKPEVIHPGEAAQAAVGTQGAGEMMSMANQPVEQYGNLVTTQALGPAMQQTQGALQNQAAYQSAAGQRAIQSSIDPMAYAQREMRLQAATDRLGQLYGVNPSDYSFQAPGAYNVYGVSNPSLSDVQKIGAGVASQLSTATVDKSGQNPRLIAPSTSYY